MRYIEPRIKTVNVPESSQAFCPGRGERNEAAHGVVDRKNPSVLAVSYILFCQECPRSTPLSLSQVVRLIRGASGLHCRDDSEYLGTTRVENWFVQPDDTGRMLDVVFHPGSMDIDGKTNIREWATNVLNGLAWIMCPQRADRADNWLAQMRAAEAAKQTLPSPKEINSVIDRRKKELMENEIEIMTNRVKRNKSVYAELMRRYCINETPSRMPLLDKLVRGDVRLTDDERRHADTSSRIGAIKRDFCAMESLKIAWRDQCEFDRLNAEYDECYTEEALRQTACVRGLGRFEFEVWPRIWEWRFPLIRELAMHLYAMSGICRVELEDLIPAGTTSENFHYGWELGDHLSAIQRILSGASGRL